MNCDDLGYGDLGCYGTTVNCTSALDRMAARTGQTELAVEALLKDSPRIQYEVQGINNGGRDGRWLGWRPEPASNRPDDQLEKCGCACKVTGFRDIV